MPSVRSIILIAVLVFVVAMAVACLEMLRPPDSGGMGGDSYGTRSYGYRALFEILDELEIPVRRQLRPPAGLPTEETLVFLAPKEDLVGVEPKYLHNLLSWVERGGRIVVAIAPSRYDFDEFDQEDWTGEPLPTVFEALGLDEVSTISVGAVDLGEEFWDPTPDDYDEFSETVLESWTAQPIPVRPVQVEATGSFADAAGQISSLAVPGDYVNTLDVGELEPVGTLDYTDAEESTHHLAAEFARGEGTIVIVGDAYVFSNRLIAREENSVLAARLMSPDGGPVVFNEFYHGLSVRGNPLYLLTRPGYAAVAIGVILAVGVWTWREAVFLGPPLPDAEVQRRDIGEYVNAMARFFHRGRRSRPFLLREVRDGVLHHVCVETGLPPETHDIDAALNALERRDPGRAAELRKAFRDVDDQLAGRQHGSESEIAHLMQRMTACL